MIREEMRIEVADLFEMLVTTARPCGSITESVACRPTCVANKVGVKQN
jgi:hypothetical protein